MIRQDDRSGVTSEEVFHRSNMDVCRPLGRNFARLRLAKGFSQERFAEVSGVTQQYVSGLERNPTVVTLYDLASALEVSPVELVDARRRNAA